MQKPMVHLNGTSSDSLIEGYATAGAAIRKAIEALHEAAPNARDYYPLGEGAFSLAQREHQDRAKRLTSVLEEIHELAEHVAISQTLREQARKR